MHLILLQAKIHAVCRSRAGCDIDTPNENYAVNYAFMLSNTMREKAREIWYCSQAGSTKYFPFTTETEVFSSKLGHIYADFSSVAREQGDREEENVLKKFKKSDPILKKLFSSYFPLIQSAYLFDCIYICLCVSVPLCLLM